ASWPATASSSSASPCPRPWRCSPGWRATAPRSSWPRRCAGRAR
ncbi:MAG: hypothetical protein AVDCRST_MAG13-1910, partial [uncultured Solirubrobacteraceae bacterium]